MSKSAYYTFIQRKTKPISLKDAKTSQCAPNKFDDCRFASNAWKMSPEQIQSEYILLSRLHFAHLKLSSSNIQNQQRFKEIYGVSPATFQIIWETLIPNLMEGCLPKLLFWTLLFLKVYATETVTKSIIGVDERTFRSWTRYVIKQLCALNKVRYFLQIKVNW